MKHLFPILLISLLLGSCKEEIENIRTLDIVCNQPTDFLCLPEGFTYQQVTNNLESPTSLAFAPNATNRLFVNELQTGKIRIIQNDQLLSEDFGSVPVRFPGTTIDQGEAGLIGIAFDPDYAANKFVYVSYSTISDDTVFSNIGRFTDNNNIGEDFTIIIDSIPSSPSHQIQSIVFGEDGKMYIPIGDAFLSDNSQNLNTLAGSILRINKDGSIPIDNPFPNSYIYAYGIRNTYDLTFLPNGDLVTAENGPNISDEFNVIEAGNNYGWPEVLGVANHPAYTDPIFVWNEVVGPTGMCLYTGDQFPEIFKNKLLLVLYGKTLQPGSSFIAKRIQMVDFEGNGQNAVPSFTDIAVYNDEGLGNPLDITVSPDGALYFTDVLKGAVYKISYAE
ncbi:MAG: PQQ-dependent sugar dehydrogenase [Chitinophagales bacterium]